MRCKMLAAIIAAASSMAPCAPAGTAGETQLANSVLVLTVGMLSHKVLHVER